MAKKVIPRIYCVEAAWSSRMTDSQTVLPILDLLEKSGRVKSVHDKVHTKDEFLTLAGRWPQRQYNDYRIGYFVGHGSPGVIHVGRNRVTLEELGTAWKAQLTGKVVYFGSCAVFDVDPDDILRFKRATRAKAVCGYVNEVDWFEAASFELLLFQALTTWTRVDVVDRYLHENAEGLHDKLHFELY